MLKAPKMGWSCEHVGCRLPQDVSLPAENQSPGGAGGTGKEWSLQRDQGWDHGPCSPRSCHLPSSLEKPLITF